MGLVLSLLDIVLNYPERTTLCIVDAVVEEEEDKVRACQLTLTCPISQLSFNGINSF